MTVSKKPHCCLICSIVVRVRKVEDNKVSARLQHSRDFTEVRIHECCTRLIYVWKRVDCDRGVKERVRVVREIAASDFEQVNIRERAASSQICIDHLSRDVDPVNAGHTR